MGQEFWRAIQTGPFPLGHRNAELFCVPIDDDGRQQIQPGDAEVLAFACAVSDLALTSNPQGSLQCMMRLALIEAAICAALHVGVEKPFDDEERPFDPPDFAKRKRQIVLPRSGGQFLKELTGLHPAGEHRRDATQNVRPIGNNRGLPNPVARQPLQLFWASSQGLFAE